MPILVKIEKCLGPNRALRTRLSQMVGNLLLRSLGLPRRAYHDTERLNQLVFNTSILGDSWLSMTVQQYLCMNFSIFIELSQQGFRALLTRPPNVFRLLISDRARGYQIQIKLLGSVRMTDLVVLGNHESIDEAVYPNFV
jgi:hypothetical protein